MRSSCAISLALLLAACSAVKQYTSTSSDAVLTEVNGLGEHVRATVVRYTPQADASKPQ